MSKKDVKIPSSVTTIKEGAFRYCKSLTSLTIPANVQNIGDNNAGGDSLLSFCVDKDNAFYSAVDGVLYDKSQKELVQCPRGKRGDVKMPSSVSKIRQGAFSGCEFLTSIEISPGVTEIPNDAFTSCESLKSVTIPARVKKIGRWSFAGCKSLTSITIPSSVTTIDYGTFSSCTSLTSVTIQSGLTTIGECAFAGCKSLTSVTMPSSVTTIGEEAFKGCKNLVRVTIPSSVTSIGKQAFCGCQCLVSVKIPEGVTWIKEKTFDGCESLATLRIPSSVTRIDDEAFSGCKSLVPVAIPLTVRRIGKGVFKDCKEEYKELSRLFGMNFGDGRPIHFEYSHYNIGNIPAYNYRPEKQFLDFDLYTIMYDDTGRAFFIRAQKECSALDEAMELVRKARAAIERKYGKMTVHNVVQAHADIHELYFDIEFDNHKTIRLGTAAGNVVSIIGFDPVAWDLTEKAKQENDDAL